MCFCYNIAMNNITLNNENIKNLELFEEMLKKDKETMINEALKSYFADQYEQLEDTQNSQTNLSYEEFWDDMDI